MRVLCVARHAFLSEHFCRVFGLSGASCEPCVGGASVLPAVARFEPEIVICDSDVLTPALLDSWSGEPALASIPVLTVSLTRRPDDSLPADFADPTAAIYLPALDRAQRAALLASVHRPRAVPAPATWPMQTEAPSAHLL